MTKIQYINIDDKPKKILDALAKDGCIILNGVLNDQDLSLLKNELEPHFEKTPDCQGDFYGYKTKRMSSLVARSKTCQRMVLDPAVKKIMDFFLLRNCERYQLHLTQAIRIGPKEYRQPLHRDDVMFPYSHSETEAMINCMWAVDDFTEENGATLVVPGSHLWPRDREATNDETVKAVMPAGSVLIWLGSLLHAGGQNETNRTRTGIVISYCLGWLRQAENHYLAIPKEVAQAFPEELQRLLGYFVHSPNLGCVEGQDPIKLLQGYDLAKSGFEEFIPEEVRPLLKEHRKRCKAA